jgi:hypothetical protein
MRRLKVVSLTIPCVVGPYTNINCTLTLLHHKTRVKNVGGASYPEREDGEDDRFVTHFAALPSIATSHAQNDSGLFELSFRDERYLPFEGVGAIGRWRIDLPQESNAFDFETLSDVVLHLKYTAREGGELLKEAAQIAISAHAGAEGRRSARLFSLKHEFPTEWYRFRTTDTAGDHLQTFALAQERFPFQFRGHGIEIRNVHVFVVPKSDPLSPFAAYLTPANDVPSDVSDLIDLTSDALFGGILHQVKSYAQQPKGVGDWTLAIRSAAAAQLAREVDDIWIICEYAAIPRA